MDELNALEAQVAQLVLLLSRLRTENSQLKEALLSVENERNSLVTPKTGECNNTSKHKPAGSH